MRRIILLLISIVISASAFSQDVVKLGNELLNSTDMEDARFILVNNGMTIETSDKIFIDHNKQIIASNGSNVVCSVAAEKQNNHVTSVTFICKGMIDGLEENLFKLEYKAVSNTENGEYCSGNKNCKISHQTLNGIEVMQIDFSINRTQNPSFQTITSFGEKVLQLDRVGAVSALKEYGFKGVRTDKFKVENLKNELCDVVSGGTMADPYSCQVYFRKDETTPALIWIYKTYSNDETFLNEWKGSATEGYLEFSSDPLENTITLIRIVEEGKDYFVAKVKILTTPHGTLTYTEMCRQTSVDK